MRFWGFVPLDQVRDSRPISMIPLRAGVNAGCVLARLYPQRPGEMLEEYQAFRPVRAFPSFPSCSLTIRTILPPLLSPATASPIRLRKFRPLCTLLSFPLIAA